MKTKILNDTTEEIEEAAKIIAGGGLVAFPTETVYGLGADALNSQAVGKVYAAKGRPSDNPMIVHISSYDDMKKLTPQITRDMEKLMKVFLARCNDHDRRTEFCDTRCDDWRTGYCRYQDARSSCGIEN